MSIRRILLIGALLILFSARIAPAITSVGALKTMPDAAQVSLEGAVVTLCFPGFFYVQDSNRVGIRITSSQVVSPNTKVTVTGVMSTVGCGERAINATGVTLGGSGSASPLGMPISAVGGSNVMSANGGQIGATGGVGLNNVGWYIRAWGRVVGSNKLSDGSHELNLIIPQGASPLVNGALVAVTGISNIVSDGNGNVVPAVLIAKPNDIQVLGVTTLYGGEMIRIPEGDFLMGAVPGDGTAFPSEKPQHSVYLNEYSIGKYEVTRGEYRKFMDAGGYQNPSYWSQEGWYYKCLYNLTQPAWWDKTWLWDGFQFQTDNHPVVGISWYEAEAYCNWAGVRLPTEAEWEKAAHWNPDLGVATIYPWGNNWDPMRVQIYSNGILPTFYTAPVGFYPTGASYYGCMDMAGNVWEWVQDWMDPTYYQQTPLGGWVNPQGPLPNQFKTKVIKGGGWWGLYPGIYYNAGDRSSNRGELYARWNEYPNMWGGKIGFRVVK